MKKVIYFLNISTSFQSIVITALLLVFILFFLGKDFNYIFLHTTYNTEKKYQDEEQSEKSEKEPDFWYSIITETHIIHFDLSINRSLSYFSFTQKDRCKGFSNILSPPPDSFFL